jgi:hypothetical protein
MLIEGSSEPTLILEVFVTKDAPEITDRAAPCPHHNAGLVPALKNLTITMHIVFSDNFEKSSSTFVNHLEGARKILEVSPGSLP